MTTKALPDVVFKLAGLPDPFVSPNPYLRALMDLPPKDRKMVVRQVALLCMAIEGLDPLGALELISAVSPYLGGAR